MPHTVDRPRVARAGLQPHRLERYMRSTDPDFETKAADMIGLYLNPPQHAAVFCVDEKTAIQALDRLDPVLPLSPGRAERHGFEYYRHGTLSLYAALDTQTGEIVGQTGRAPHQRGVRRRSSDGGRDAAAAREIHIILDNLSAHKTQTGAHVPGASSARAAAFHADVFVLAQPSRTLVCEDRTRCDRARHLHVGHRPARAS